MTCMTAVLSTLVIGLVVSFITGYTKPKDVDPKLICPIFDIIFPFSFLPECIRKPLRFGVNHKDKYQEPATDEKQDAEKEQHQHVESYLNLALEVDEKKEKIDISKIGTDTVGMDKFHTKL
ncbi:hypothetical protein Btru_008087 [Bulinus truncatus]|nr:hypothetical protein Btru_008087 [Bulinus truncatus]